MMLVELARVSGITEGQLSCIENSGYTLTLRNTKTIGRVLEVGEDWLLTGNDRNRYHPVNDELIEFLKDHEDVRIELWRKIESMKEDNKW